MVSTWPTSPRPADCRATAAGTRPCPAWHRVTTANPDNGNHWESLARACFEAGDYERALAAYLKVAGLGVTAAREDIAAPGAIWYRIACCHAHLSDPESALCALADAVRCGYRDVGAAWDDEHLAALRSRPELASLLGRPHPGLTREQRWRFDADFLVREIDRRAPQRTSAQCELLDRSRIKLAERLPDLTDAQVVAEFMRWVAALDDGHGSVDVADTTSALAASMPVEFQLFSEGLFVTAAHPDLAALLGARVVAFEDYPVPGVLAAIDPLVSRDNVYGATERAMQVMRRTAILHALGIVDAPDGAELELEYPNGRRERLAVTALPQAWRRRNEIPGSGGLDCLSHAAARRAPAVPARLRAAALVRVPGRP